ncbi:MAG: alkaline phosphatase [Balneolaceae bacterium]
MNRFLKPMLPVLFTLLLLSVSACTGAEEPDRPKNIILMIGDGMGVSQVTAGYYSNDFHLVITEAPYVGLVDTHPATEDPDDNGVVDSAASATAISTGVKTLNRYIGMDPDRNPVRTILEVAHENSLATGIVASSSITHATPASFIAHQPDRGMMEEIAADFLETDIDLFIGGGRQYFAEREDGRDLLSELSDKGYQVLHDIEEMKQVSSGKLAGFIADGEPPRYSEGRGDMLPEATQLAIDLLSQNENGFFLTVEGSQIDWAGHNNDMDYLIEELHDFDRAVAAAVDFARRDGNTLVIITADHETGGTALNGVNLSTGEIEPGFTSGGHTGAMVPVFAFGPGAEAFSGIYHQVEIFNKQMEALGFPLESE